MQSLLSDVLLSYFSSSLDLELTILASLASQRAPGLVLGLGRASPHPAFDVATWDSNRDLMVLQEALYPRH